MKIIERSMIMPQFAKKYETPKGSSPIRNYLLFLPKGYDEEPNRKWPLILFLHGIGQRGDDPEVLKVHGIPRIVEENPDFQFVAVSPQCPEDTEWVFQTDALNEFIDYILASYNVNPEMVYLTGLSMGGHGVWKLAIAHADKFAAIAPICGHKCLEGIENIKHMPIWLFHGAKDPVIKIEESYEMVDALKKLGSNIRFTVYPDAEHDCWTETYNNPELYQWFLKYKKHK